MKKEREEQLVRKGWSKEEISHAEKIIESRKFQDKSRSTVHTHRVLFWSVLVMMIIGNALVAVVLIPLLLVLTKLTMSLFVLVIGFSFGLLYNFLVWDIEEQLTKKHHLLAAFIVPGIAIFNLYAIVAMSNAINRLFEITEIQEDPLTISALYVVAFLLPYLWTVFVKKKIKRY